MPRPTICGLCLRMASTKASSLRLIAEVDHPDAVGLEDRYGHVLADGVDVAVDVAQDHGADDVVVAPGRQQRPDHLQPGEVDVAGHQHLGHEHVARC